MNTKSTGALYQAAVKAAHDKRRKEAKAAQALLERKAAAWDRILEEYDEWANKGRLRMFIDTIALEFEPQP